VVSWARLQRLSLTRSVSPKKRVKRAMLYSLVGILTFSAWWFWSSRRIPEDEQLYRQWWEPSLGLDRVNLLERNLPPNLFNALHLPAVQDWYCRRDWSIRQKLLTSGYLTTAHIRTTNWRASLKRLNEVTGKAQAKWMLQPHGAEVILTCRPKDLNLCTNALLNN
jgi:hypothetical protein